MELQQELPTVNPAETDCCSLGLSLLSRPHSASAALSPSLPTARALSLSPYFALPNGRSTGPPTPTKSTNWVVEMAADWSLQCCRRLKGHTQAHVHRNAQSVTGSVFIPAPPNRHVSIRLSFQRTTDCFLKGELGYLKTFQQQEHMKCGVSDWALISLQPAGVTAECGCSSLENFLGGRMSP